MRHQSNVHFRKIKPHLWSHTKIIRKEKDGGFTNLSADRNTLLALVSLVKFNSANLRFFVCNKQGVWGVIYRVQLGLGPTQIRPCPTWFQTTCPIQLDVNPINLLGGLGILVCPFQPKHNLISSLNSLIHVLPVLLHII